MCYRNHLVRRRGSAHGTSGRCPFHITKFSPGRSCWARESYSCPEYLMEITGLSKEPGSKTLYNQHVSIWWLNMFATFATFMTLAMSICWGGWRIMITSCTCSWCYDNTMVQVNMVKGRPEHCTLLHSPCTLLLFIVWALVFHEVLVTMAIQTEEYSSSCRDHFVYAPSPWEKTSHCNIVSHWLAAYTKWSLQLGMKLSSSVHVFIQLGRKLTVT